MSEQIFEPKISVIIPVYNGANYLKEAIESVLAQTYKHYEILVVNDGSNDEGRTEAVALSFGTKIRYFSKKNGGVSTALNLGLKEMHGEYFSWLSHDDVYLPNKLKAEVRCLKNYPKDRRETMIVYSDWYFINERSEITGEKRNSGIMQEALPYKMMQEWLLSGCTLLVPKRCFDESGYFDERLRCVQDTKKWFLFSRDYPFILVPEPLVKCRVHALQTGHRLREIGTEERNELYAWAFDYFLRDADYDFKNKIGFSYSRLITKYKEKGLFKAAAHVWNAIPPSLWYCRIGCWIVYIKRKIDIPGTFIKILKILGTKLKTTYRRLITA